MSTRVRATVLAWLALVLGVGHAAFSFWWALGGTWLLDTVGGGLEDQARTSIGLRLVVWVAAVVKIVAAVLPLVVVRGLAPTRLVKPTRWLAWTEGVILTAYGVVFTGVGLLVEANIVDASDDADEHALAWHAYFWDPWFLCWGVIVLLALLLGDRAAQKAVAEGYRPLGR